MTLQPDARFEDRCDKDAEDAFTSEGGHVAPELDTHYEHVQVGLADRRRLMSYFATYADRRHK